MYIYIYIYIYMYLGVHVKRVGRIGRFSAATRRRSPRSAGTRRQRPGTSARDCRRRGRCRRHCRCRGHCRCRRRRCCLCSICCCSICCCCHLPLRYAIQHLTQSVYSSTLPDVPHRWSCWRCSLQASAVGRKAGAAVGSQRVRRTVAQG